MAMIHETSELAPVILNLRAADAQEQVLMVETIVEEVERSGAEGVVFISELHLPDGRGGELVVAALTDDGDRRVWRTPIERTAPRARCARPAGRRPAPAGLSCDPCNAIRRRRGRSRARWLSSLRRSVIADGACRRLCARAGRGNTSRGSRRTREAVLMGFR